MEYKFNGEGFLEVQQIRKCDMAFFYNRTPQAFRKELDNAGVFIISSRKKFYTTTEVQRIFQTFQPISKADVENAQNRINKYLEDEKLRNIQKYNKSYELCDTDCNHTKGHQQGIDALIAAPSIPSLTI